MELWGTFQKGSAEGVPMPLVIDWGGEEGTGLVISVGSQHCPGGGAHMPSTTPCSRPLRAAFVLREAHLEMRGTWDRAPISEKQPRPLGISRERKGSEPSGEGSVLLDGILPFLPAHLPSLVKKSSSPSPSYKPGLRF